MKSDEEERMAIPQPDWDILGPALINAVVGAAAGTK